MGEARSDRLQLRRWLRPVWIGGLAVLAGTLPTSSITPQGARIAATFLGLFAAGILPTISLMLQSVNSSGKSVFRIDELEKQIRSAIDELFKILGCVGLAVFILLALSIVTPKELSFLQAYSALERLGNASVGALLAITIIKAAHIPNIIRTALEIRFEQARHEAQRATIAAAPSDQEVKAAFPTKEGFAKRTNLRD